MFTSISPVESFCSESVSASTDPSTSPLSMMLSSLNSPKAIRLPISSRVICFWVRTFCSRSSWVLLAAICLASLSSLKTKNVSPAWGAPSSPNIETGVAGGTLSKLTPLSLKIALTFPLCFPARM